MYNKMSNYLYERVINLKFSISRSLLLESQSTYNLVIRGPLQNYKTNTKTR